MSALTKVNVFSRFADQAHNSLLVRPQGLSPRYLEFVSDGTGIFDLFIDCPESILVSQYKPHDRPRGFWIQEVDALRPDLYKMLRNPSSAEKFFQRYKFDYIFTQDIDLCLADDRFRFLFGMGSSLKHPSIYSKSKLCSMITSNKNTLPMHKKRLQIAKHFAASLDLFGRGHNPVQFKEEALSAYMFSIVIENFTSKAGFTEKLLDCFLTGTIPIYLGASDIDDFFDGNGIIKFNDQFSISQLTPDLYYQRMSSIRRNFSIALNYTVPIENSLLELIEPFKSLSSNTLPLYDLLRKI